MMNQHQQVRQHDRIEGKVFSFKELLGFGFIYFNEGESIFVHKSDIPTDVGLLSAGDEVTFTIGKDFKGRACAKCVQRVAVDATGGGK
jgi:cold shock CspA family protein